MIKKEKIILKNSSSLIVVSLPCSPSTTFMVLVRSGPRFDPPSKSGLSHFVEHLSFKGTKKYPTNQALTEVLEKHGALAEAFTYQETNAFWIKSTSKHIPLAVEILMDMLQHSLFRVEDIKKEKEAVKDELRGLKSNPEGYIWEVWAGNIWQGTPLGRTFIGSEKSIESFSRKDVSKFIQQNWLVNNTVFLVCGDIKINRIRSLINRNLDNYQRDAVQRIPKVIPQRSQPVKIVKQDLENITAVYGFLTTSLFDPNRHVLELIEYLLGRGWGSRLSQKIAEEGLAYFLEAQTQQLSDTGCFLVYFTCAPKNLNRVLKIIDQEINSLTKGNFSKNELDRAKGFLTDSLQINTETSDEFAAWYGYQELLNPKEVLSLTDKCKIIEGITEKNIKEVARKYFTPQNWYLALIGNFEEKELKIKFPR